MHRQELKIQSELYAQAAQLESLYSEMPACAERSLMCLLSYLELKQAGVSIITLRKEQVEVNKKIQDEIKQLDNFLLNQEQTKNEESKKYNDIKEKISFSQWKNAKDESDNLLKLIQPFNIRKFKILLERNHEAAKIIKEKNIVLLMGETGVGKSTTIHFFAGSTLEKQKVQVGSDSKSFVYHFVPIKISNTELKNITTSPYARSETHCITPVHINIKEVGGSEDKIVVFCDMPGFGDTNGSEVDTANACSVIEAIQGCSSIKPVIVISHKSIGDKSGGLERLVSTLNSMISDSKKHLSKFCYIFTKYPKEDRDTLTGIIQTLINEKKENKPLYEFLVDMRTKSESNPIFIDLSESTRSPAYYIENELKLENTILNTGKVFRPFLSEQSKLNLQQQIAKHRSNIDIEAKNNNFSIVNYKLNDLKFLSTVLKDYKDLESTYQQAVHSIRQYIQEEYNKCIGCFNDDSLSISTIKKYQDQLYKISSFTSEIKCHTEIHLDDIGNNPKIIRKKSKNIFEDIKSNIRLNYLEKVVTSLDQAKLLSESFIDVKADYEEMKQFVVHWVSEPISSFEKLVQTNDFLQIGKIMTCFYDSINHIKPHIDYNRMLKKYEDNGLILINYLENVANCIDNIVNKARLVGIQLDKVNTYFTILNAAKNAKELCAHLSEARLSAIYHRLFMACQEYSISLQEKVKTHLRAAQMDVFVIIEPIIEEMNAMMKIPDIKEKMSAIYYGATGSLFEYISEVKMESDQAVSKLYQPDYAIDYQRLNIYLSSLKNAKWLDNIRPNYRESVIQNIEDNIKRYVDKLGKDCIELDLDIDSHQNIIRIKDVLLKLESMHFLWNSIPAIKKCQEQVKNFFYVELNIKLSKIKKKYDYKRNNLIHHENMLNLLCNINRLDGETREIELKRNQLIYILKKETKERNSKIKFLKEANEQWDEKIKQNNSIFNFIVSFCKSKSHEENLLINDTYYVGIDQLKSDIHLKTMQLKRYEEKKNYELSELDKKQKENVFLRKEYLEFIESSSDYMEDSKDIYEISRYIKSEQSIITKMKENGYDYLFERVDFLEVEKIYFYLMACRSVGSRQIAEAISSTVNQLYDYLITYFHFIEKQMNTCWENIISAKKNSDKEDIYIFLEHLKVLIWLLQLNARKKLRISENFLKLADDIIGKWRGELLRFQESLSLDMKVNGQEETFSISTLAKKLKIIQPLRKLDDVLDSKFGILYSKFQEKFVYEQKIIQDKTINYIDSGNYTYVSNIVEKLDKLHKNDYIDLSMFCFIQLALKESMRKLRETVRTNIRCMDENLDMKLAICIREGLDKVMQIKEILNGYSDSKDQALLDLVDIKKLLIDSIIRYVSSVEIAIKGFQFKFAEDRIKKIKSMLLLFNTIIDEPSLCFFDMEKYLHNQLDMISKRYKDLKIDQYTDQSPPPKFLFKQLEEAFLSRNEYFSTFSAIKLSIKDTLTSTFQKIKEISNVEEKNKLLRIVESTLECLPDDVKIIFINEFNYFKMNLQNVHLKVGVNTPTIQPLEEIEDSDTPLEAQIDFKGLNDNAAKILDEKMQEKWISFSVNIQSSIKNIDNMERNGKRYSNIISIRGELENSSRKCREFREDLILNHSLQFNINALIGNIEELFEEKYIQITDEMQLGRVNPAVLGEKTQALYCQQASILRHTDIDKALNIVLEKIKKLPNKAPLLQRCFFSYAWPTEKLSSKEKWIQPFLKILHKHLSLAGIQPLLDIINSNVNINKFMQQSERVEYAIIFCTESLRNKYYSHGSPAIKEELNHIKRKHTADMKTNSAHARVFRLLLSGTQHNSYPVGFQMHTVMHDWRDKSYLENLKLLLSWIYYPTGNFTSEYEQLWDNFFLDYPHLKNIMSQEQVSEEMKLAYHANEQKKLAQNDLYQTLQKEHGSSIDLKYSPVLFSQSQAGLNTTQTSPILTITPLPALAVTKRVT